ncbi:ATP-binding protein [Phyllobacterium sp. CCNWLW109]|uniref:ATP-binding protein n=1 Tax=Phyllobacterium sp. CCNWLW109 TaxID=3127479 RepID=UPI003076F98E
MAKPDMTNRNNPSPLVHLLLKRLRREAVSIATGKAIAVDVLSAKTKRIGEHRVTVYKAGIIAVLSDEAGIRHRLEIARRTVSHQSIRYELDSDELMTVFEDAVPDIGTNEKTVGTPVPPDQVSRFDVLRLIGMVRDSADPPYAADVATLLMLADAVNQYPPRLQGILEVLRRSRPIIVIIGEVPGFVNTFLSLMKRGLLTFGAITKANGYANWKKKDLQFDYVRAPRSKVICFAEQDYEKSHLTDRVGYAANSPHPIVAIATTDEKVPSTLIEAAQLHLTCGPLTAEIVSKTIETVLGAPPVLELSDADCSLLGLAELELAIRPGVSPTRAIEILAEFIAEKRKGGPGNDSQQTSRDNSNVGQATTTSSSRNNVKSTGSEIIQPVKPEHGKSSKLLPLVETLSGYGDAKEWAVDLKDDLALWRSGEVEWSDMSTKLLLSGPPGTGKTFFARALCNSLEIPLVATSVATWLEGGHLGDDLRRMGDTFKEASAHRPCILFVDEIDGIGTRGNDRGRYSDYWNTLVNRALELFDGVSKTDGVIILTATNLPSLIDPALLRSGRLERHIPIPPPDIDTLCGILKHQVGADLARIVPSGLEALKISRENNRSPFRQGTSGLDL